MGAHHQTIEADESHRQNEILFIGGLVGFLAVVTALVVAFSAGQPSQPSGEVLNVELHSTLLHSTSSVRTSTGTYQVWGAVSWVEGDTATVRQDKVGEGKSLCIESRLKNACYQIR